MQRIRVIAAFLLLSAAVWAQSSPRPGEPKIIPQPGSPAVLSAGHVNKAPAVQLRNRSGKTVVAYRLGWFDAAGKVSLGERTLLRLRRGERVWIRSRDFARYPGARFFIAELAFGNGTAWKADVDALRREETKEAVPSPVRV